MQKGNQPGPEASGTTAGPPADWPGSGKTVQFLSLDSGQSRTERFAVALVHKLRDAAPSGLLLFSDVAALIFSCFVAEWLGGPITPLIPHISLYAFFATYCAVLILGYAFIGLYFTGIQSGPEELKRVTLGTTMSTIIMALIIYESSDFYYGVHTSTFLIAWAVALFAVPFGCATTRGIFAPRLWWGHKAIILSTDPKMATKLVHALRTQPRLGIKPVAILSAKDGETESREFGVPRLHGTEAALQHARSHGIHYAIVTLPDLNEPEGLAMIRKYENFFRHWLIVPYFSQNYSLWVNALDLNGLLGLEVTNRLKSKGEKLLKRVMDVALTLAGGIFVLPLGLLIALAIKLDSQGPAIYGQKRLGKGGKPFMALKFRSMVQNADGLLADYLAEHPELEVEWQETQKLKNDPRITRLGRLLRKTSLDELPQLINVLRGEMSLVGPRPIVAAEIARYDWVWELYKRTRPGITGQWQVSGRNNTSYAERTAMDSYYIRNWSIWLDIYILARTFIVVLRRDGAY